MAYKQDKARREESPKRYERKPTEFRDPADRSKKWREEHGQKKATLFIPIIYTPTNQEGLLLGIDDSTITLDLDGATQAFDLTVLFNHLVFQNESDIDMAYGKLDQIFDHESESKVASRYADFLYEKRPPDKEPGQNFDRASPAHHMWPEHEPGHDLDTGTTWDNPGSAKVIPEGHDFENRADRALKEAAIRVAMRISDIQERTGPKVHDTARKVQVKLTRVDTANHMWMFVVPGSKKGTSYKVRVKAAPTGNVTDVNKMDVHVSCTCPFWRWQGPEHHAKKNDYLYGKPAGTASVPDVKDPTGKHWACKHILAVLAKVKTFKPGGAKPTHKVASIQWLSDTLQGTDLDYHMPTRVAARYLVGQGG
jgi:hypothetical protein